ncbi:sugar ABC transporter permease [Candidatus Aerophobetes bacterium]|nr:sugar ABC transporter permease [Candidatus Aerophobetes bacterium]
MLNRGDKVGVEREPVKLRGRKTVWQLLTGEKYIRWALVVPLLIVLAAFMFYPLFYCLYMSFQFYVLRKPSVFIGMENYRMVLHDMVFWLALGRTFYVLVVSIAVELALGMGIALLLNREFKGQNTIRGVCLLPLLISPLAMSLMWNYMLHVQFGIVNQVMVWIGLDRVEWFASPKTAIYCIMLISIWQWTPFSIFVILAGLKGMPKDALEAANVDGASRWFIFRKLTLPSLMPLIIIVILLRTMWLIRIFDPLYGTTRGGVGTELLDWMVYRIAFVFFDVGKAGALAIFSLYITIVLCAVLFRQLMKALGAAR